MSFPVSDHCNGKTFFYPGEKIPRSLLDVLRWKFSSRPAQWPSWVELLPQPAPPIPHGDEIVVTWIGHATFLFQTTQGNFLTDPVFSQRCSPVSWLGPKRVHAPGIAFDALPKIHGVLLSHDHYDHCDLPTLKRLQHVHQPLVIAPLGHAALLNGIGLDRVVELDWWQTHAWSPSFAITLTPSKHWCRRSAGETNSRLWGGFFLRAPNRRIYFMGDTGAAPNVWAQIKTKLGAPDFACIPIGAYEPRWFMRSAHQNPAEAVDAHLLLSAKRSVAMHWGTFQLTDESREAPPSALAAAKAAANLSDNAFAVMTPGGSTVV